MSNKRTIEKNSIKDDNGVVYFKPIIGKDWNYALMAPDKHRADTIQNSNSVKMVSQVQWNYNTNC